MAESGDLGVIGGRYHMQITSKKDELLWKEVMTGSDRAVAIVATSYMNDKLEAAICAQLRAEDPDALEKTFKLSAPMGGLGPKINLGYLMKLYRRADFARRSHGNHRRRRPG